MLEHLTREEILASMKRMPETWADLFVEQRKMIQDLEVELKQLQSRLEYKLRKPGETKH